MTVTVLIYVVGWDSFPPRGTALKLEMVNVDTGIDDVDVNTLATIWIICIGRESAEGEFIPVANASETL